MSDDFWRFGEGVVPSLRWQRERRIDEAVRRTMSITLNLIRSGYWKIGSGSRAWKEQAAADYPDVCAEYRRIVEREEGRA